MKHIITTIIFVSSLSCFGQTKELFLNSVYKVFVDTSFTKYHLYSEAYKLQIDKYHKPDVIKDFSEFISVETINELLNKAETDTSKLTWDCKFLNLANCVENSNGILLGNYLVQIDRKWSKKRQKKETDRQVNEQNEEYNKKPKQERTIYSFSRPVFDNKNEHAIISLWLSCGNLCGHGCIYLFKKVDGVWQSISTTHCRLS